MHISYNIMTFIAETVDTTNTTTGKNEIRSKVSNDTV